MAGCSGYCCRWISDHLVRMLFEFTKGFADVLTSSKIASRKSSWSTFWGLGASIFQNWNANGMVFLMFLDVFLLAIPSHLSSARPSWACCWWPWVSSCWLSWNERPGDLEPGGTRRNLVREPMTTSHWLERLGLGRRTQHLVHPMRRLDDSRQLVIATACW